MPDHIDSYYKTINIIGKKHCKHARTYIN